MTAILPLMVAVIAALWPGLSASRAPTSSASCWPLPGLVVESRWRGQRRRAQPAARQLSGIHRHGLRDRIHHYTGKADQALLTTVSDRRTSCYRRPLFLPTLFLFPAPETCPG